VAEEEGFAAAARRFNMSPPAVTRAVAALEQRLGVKLLTRTTRHVRTTEAGHHYLQDARRILVDVDAADESAAGIHSAPRGQLAVTAPAMFGRLFITPVIVKYLQQFPDTDVSAVFLDRVVNLVEEGLDVGIRIGELPDSSLRAVRVGSIRHVVCASPEYIKQHGLPQHPDELANHLIIASSAGNQSPVWGFKHTGHTHPVKLKPRLTTTTNDAAIVAAEQGFGLTRVLSYQIASQLAVGALKIVLADFETPAKPVHIVHQQGRNVPAKVRAFIDLAATLLRVEKALN